VAIPGKEKIQRFECVKLWGHIKALLLGQNVYSNIVNLVLWTRASTEKMKEALGFRAKGKKVICADDTFELREMLTVYGKANILDFGNTFLWN
jgi:hypothetical protein